MRWYAGQQCQRDDLGVVVSATVKAAAHLGQYYQENMRTTMKTDFEKVKQLFDISQKLILNQKDEIFVISTIEWNTIPWDENDFATTVTTTGSTCGASWTSPRLSMTSETLSAPIVAPMAERFFWTVQWSSKKLLNDRAVKLSKAEVHVFSDLVLCFGKFHEHLRSIDAWKQKIEWFTKFREYRELNGIDGRTTRVRVDYFPRTHNSEDRIIFMSMYNDIDWTKAGHKEDCISNSLEVKRTQRTLVIRRTRNRRKVEWNAHQQAKRFLERFCRDEEASSHRKCTSKTSSKNRVRPRIFEKQRRRKIIDSQQRWFDDSRVVVSHDHFRQSAQCLRRQYRIVAQNSFRRSQIIRFPVRGDPWRIWMTSRSPESHPTSCQSQWIHLRSMFRYRETCCEVKTKGSRHFQRIL